MISVFSEGGPCVLPALSLVYQTAHLSVTFALLYVNPASPGVNLSYVTRISDLRLMCILPAPDVIYHTGNRPVMSVLYEFYWLWT